jgi:hypothetical protein
MALPNERISQYTQRERQQLRQGRDMESADLRDAYGQVERLVRENPGYAVLATFATGLGAGLLLAGLTAPKRRDSPKFHDYLGENAREAIQNAVARFVPDAVSRFLSKQR